MAPVAADKVLVVGHRAVEMMGRAKYLEELHKTALVVPRTASVAVNIQESLPADTTLAYNFLRMYNAYKSNRALSKAGTLTPWDGAIRRIIPAAKSSIMFCRFLCLVFRQSLFQLSRRLEFRFLHPVTSSASGPRISRCSSSLCLSLGKLSENALIVGCDNVFRYTFHAKYFYIQAGTVGESIVNSC